MGVNLPPEDTYYNWLNVSDGLPYVRLVNDSNILDLTRAQVEGNWQPGEEIAGYNYRLENGFHLYELQPEASLPEGLPPRIAIATGEVLTGVVPRGFVAYEALNLIDSQLYGALPVVLPTDISLLRDGALLGALAVGVAADFQNAEPNVAYIAAAVIEHLENTWTADLRQTLEPIFTGVSEGTYNADVWVHVLSRVRNRSGKYNRLLTAFRSEVDSLENQISESALPAWQRAAGHLPGGGPVEDLAEALNSDGGAVYQLVRITKTDVTQLQELAFNIVVILSTPRANIFRGDRVVPLAQELEEWGDRLPEPFQVLKVAVSKILYDRFDVSFGRLRQLSVEEQDQVLDAARLYRALNPGNSQETAQAQLVEEQIAETLFSRFEATLSQFYREKGNEEAQQQALQTLADIERIARRRFSKFLQDTPIRRGFQKIIAERQQRVITELESTATPIEKNIHGVWIGGAVDETKIGILEAWKDANPDYTVNLWYDSDALLGNLLRRAIHTKLDQELPPPVAFQGGNELNEEELLYVEQRKALAAPIYDQTEEFLRLNGGGDEARALLLVDRYRDYLIQRLGLSLEASQSELAAAVEAYRQEQQQRFTDLSSDPSLRIRDLQTEVLPSSQNQDFYRTTLRLFGGAFASASDIARVEILRAEGGLYTDLDILPGEPLGDLTQPQEITGFLLTNLNQDKVQQLLNGDNPLLNFSVMTAHREGQQITLQSDLLQQNYQSYLRNSAGIYRLPIRLFARNYTSTGSVIVSAVRRLGQDLFGPIFDLQSLFKTFSIPTRFVKDTPDGLVSAWEITREDDLRSVDILFERTLAQVITEVYELQQLLKTDRSTLTSEEKATLEANINLRQQDLAMAFPHYFWVAVKTLSPLNPRTGRIISPRVEERVFELLDRIFQFAPVSFLTYEHIKAFTQIYLSNQLPATPYPLEQGQWFELPNAPSLHQAFVAELAASRIALDLATEADALTEEQAILADALEAKLRIRILTLVSRL